MKNKGATLLLSLTGISLLTVGFSAWIITGLAGENDTSKVDVAVGETIDSRVKFDTVSVVDNTIRFDALDNTSSGGIITNNSDSEIEDMRFEISFSLTNALTANGNAFTDYMKTTKLTFSLTAGDKQSNFEESCNANYIVSPLEGTDADDVNFSTATIGVGEPSYHETTATNQETYLRKKVSLSANATIKTTCDVKLEYGFGWGSAFNKNNPSALKDQSKVSDYLTNLQDLKTKLDTAKFTFTINHALI